MFFASVDASVVDVVVWVGFYWFIMACWDDSVPQN